MKRALLLASVVFVLGSVNGCGDDDDENEARRRGVGAECVGDEDCKEPGQTCLAFKGGYCGVSDCTSDAECPAGSACVAHDDGETYCFLVCVDKAECNFHRSPESESNCSSNITFTDAVQARKACVPPS
jgi:hypothetical protein